MSTGGGGDVIQGNGRFPREVTVKNEETEGLSGAVMRDEKRAREFLPW